MTMHQSGAAAEHDPIGQSARRTREALRQRMRAETLHAAREIRDALAGAAMGAGAYEFLTWISGS